MTNGDLWRTCMALLAALATGCGGQAPQPVPSSVANAADPSEEVAPVAADSPANLPAEATGLAALGEALPFGINRDEPFAEVKLFSQVTLQFQRMIILQERKLHTELKLSEAQVRAFTAHGDDVKGLQEGLQKIRPEERETKMLKEYVPKAERYKALVEKELTAAQQFAVLQKVAQKQRGAIALLLPGVPEHLKMTDTQLAAIFQIVDENRKSVNWDELKGPVELMKLMRRANAARQEAEDQLTELQKKQWQALLGK